MAVPRCSNGMPVNVVIDNTNEVISLEQTSFLIDRQKSDGCTSECLSCHFSERYLRDLDPETIESVLANGFQVTNLPVQGGEIIVGWVDEVPVIIPSAIYWDVLQLHELENEQIRKYIKRSWKFPISGRHIRMVFSHYEDSLDRDEDGCPIYPDEIEPPAHDGNEIETLPTTPVTARLGRPRTSFSMTPPQYSPRPCWNGLELTHPREVIAHGGQVAPFYHTAAAPEPPTYASCGPFEQPPDYEPQHLPLSVDSSATVSAFTTISDAGPSSLGQGVSDTLISSVVQNLLTTAADSSFPNLPGRRPTRLQEQSVHIPRLLARSSDQKYEYTPEQPELTHPSLEQVVRYLSLPRLVRQDANYALLPDMVEEAVNSMDRIIDDLVDAVQSFDFVNPRTPPPVPSSNGSSVSMSDFPIPARYDPFQPLSPSHLVPAGRLSLNDHNSDSDNEEVESVSDGDGHSSSCSDDAFWTSDHIGEFCTEAVAQMLMQDNIAHTVLGFYSNYTDWNIHTLMQAFNKMKFRRSVMRSWTEDQEPRDLGFTVDPQDLEQLLLTLGDDYLTHKPVGFGGLLIQPSDFTDDQIQTADCMSELASVVCHIIVQELLTGDSIIHRVVAQYPPDTHFDLPTMVEILVRVDFRRGVTVLDARDRAFARQTFPQELLDPDVELYCQDLEEPTLQELTELSRYPYCLENAKRENPELMQTILGLFPIDTIFTITLTRGILGILESEKNNQDRHRRDEEARTTLSNSATTLQRLLDHDTLAAAEAQLYHPISPPIFRGFSTGFNEPTSPSAFDRAISDELFLPTSPTPTAETTNYNPQGWSPHTSLPSETRRTSWTSVHPTRAMQPQEYPESSGPTFLHTITTTIIPQNQPYQAYHPPVSPPHRSLRPQPYYPGETPATPPPPPSPPLAFGPSFPRSSPPTPFRPSFYPQSSSLLNTPTPTPTPTHNPTTTTTFAATTTATATAPARRVHDLHTFSQRRLTSSSIRDDSYLDGTMIQAIESFAQQVSAVEAEIEGLVGTSAGTASSEIEGQVGAGNPSSSGSGGARGSRIGRRGAISE